VGGDHPRVFVCRDLYLVHALTADIATILCIGADKKRFLTIRRVRIRICGVNWPDLQITTIDPQLFDVGA
jgi:hypothetical protein